jgi:hypothetical protein
MSAFEHFERAAAEFYRETGMMFTKEELRMIDKGVDQLFKEWCNGYKSAGRVYVAGRIREKVRAALMEVAD